MSSVDHRHSRRVSIIIVPVVVVTAVALVMIILTVASAYAQDSDITSTSLESLDDLEDAEVESDGYAPSINKLIVVSDGAPIETSTSSLPASGFRSRLLSIGIAISLLGVMTRAANIGVQ